MIREDLPDLNLRVAVVDGDVDRHFVQRQHPRIGLLRRSKESARPHRAQASAAISEQCSPVFHRIHQRRFRNFHQPVIRADVEHAAARLDRGHVARRQSRRSRNSSAPTRCCKSPAAIERPRVHRVRRRHHRIRVDLDRPAQIVEGLPAPAPHPSAKRPRRTSRRTIRRFTRTIAVIQLCFSAELAVVKLACTTRAVENRQPAQRPGQRPRAVRSPARRRDYSPGPETRKCC